MKSTTNKAITTAKEIRDAYVFNTPMLIFAIAFIIVPIIGTLITSLFRDVTFLPDKFIGLLNYSRLITDLHFWQSVRFTMLFVLLSVFLELFFGMLFALVLNETIPGRGFLRVAILIPWAIPIAIAGRIWELIYNYEFGLFNYLALNAGLTDSSVNWLGSSTGAFFAIVISDVWKTTPFMAIILLAGLSIVPPDLYKQAQIDGTNFIQRFFKITLPVLRPILVVALLFRTIDAVRIFDLVYVLTGGGPGGSTTSLSLYAYNYYLSGDFGYGSAVSLFIFLIAGFMSVLYLKFGKFRETVQ
jgi:multiple sugar transport system permease protein